MTAFFKWIIVPTLTILFGLTAFSNEDRHTDGEVKKLKIPFEIPTEMIDTINGRGVTIITSLPKGGGFTYKEKNFGYRIFWSRVINNTTVPIELTVNFPSDSFIVMPESDKHLKLFLPPGAMTFAKEIEYDYGVTEIQSFLDTGLNRPTTLKTVIKPKEEYMFNTGALFYPGNGLARAKLLTSSRTDVAKLDLSYSISIGASTLSIPCGQIVFKK
jgi:hypothetical protein